MEQNKLEQNVEDLIETVGYIKDNMATKDELARVEEITLTTRDNLARLEKHVDENFVRIDKNFAKLEKHVDGMETRLVTNDYLDNKLADLGAEIGERINRWAEKERKFKEGLIELLERHQIGDAEELSHLRELI